MSYTKKALRGFAIVFIFNMLAGFLGYLIRIVLAKNLTVAEYGLFFAVFTLISLFAIFNDIGLGEALVKYIPDFLVKKQAYKIKSSILIILGVRFITIFFLATLLFFISDFLAINYFKTALAAPVILLFIFIMFFSNLKGLLRCIFHGLQRMTIYAFMYFVENILMLVMLLVLFLYYKRNIFVAVYVHILVYVIIIIIFSLVLFKVFNFFKYKAVVNSKLAKKLFKFGIPTIMAGIGGMVILYIDTLILTFFRSLEEVGIYNVVVPSVMMILFFGKTVGSVVLPMASELWARKKKKYLEHALVMLEKYSFVIIIPAALVILAFSRIILNLFFGAEYAQGAATMQVLIVGVIFLVIFGINSNLFSAMGRPGIGTKILFQGAVINLVLNLFFIPLWGMLGAAITSLITYFYIFVVSVFKLRHFIKVKIPWLNWLKTFVAGAVMLGLIFGLKQLLSFTNIYLEVIIIGIIAGLAYLALILLMKIVEIKEIHLIIKSVMQKS